MKTHTTLFKESIEKDIPFKPVQTIVSENFGRHFFIDRELNFLSAPSYSKQFIETVLFDTDMMKDEKLAYDESQLDYVGNWTELEGIDLDKLLDINRKLCWNQWQEDKDKARDEYLELEHAVETGDIVYF